MFIRDNHLHTHHSYDSDANFTDYLTHFDGEIVHHNGVNDYLDDEVADMDKANIIQEYLDKLEYAVGRVDADVLATLTMVSVFLM